MTARDLLGFRVSSAELAVAADDPVTSRTEAAVGRAAERLRRVADAHRSIGVEPPPDAGTIARRFLLLCRVAPDRVESEFSSGRMARKLAASLCHQDAGGEAIARSEHLQRALLVLSRHDRTSVLLGALDALLRTWDAPQQAERLRTFLRPRLEAYGGRVPSLLHARDNARYLLRADGPVALGADTALAGAPFGDAVDALRLTASARATPYFDELAVAYARSALRTAGSPGLVHSLLSALEERARGDIHKRCLAPVVLAVDARPDEGVRDRLQSIAFHTVGDPIHEHLWAPWGGASEREADELRRARAVLNRWIAQRFITVFFEKVAMDPDREAFWLQYAPHVSRFRVYGDSTTRYRLHQDPRLQPYLDGRFCRGTLANGSNALLLRVKDRTIVEFGDKGNACYVYLADGDKAPPLDKCIPAGRLKKTRMGLLFGGSGASLWGNTPLEGRVIHSAGWEHRFARWLRNNLGV